MKLLAVLVLAGVALLLVLTKKKKRLGKAADQAWPFYVKKPLSHPEQILYHRLVKALPEHIGMAQVRVSRLLGVKHGSNFNEWNNRVNRLSYDFVICTRDSSVLAAIELDDKSHDSHDRGQIDRKKEKATADAG